MITGRVDVSVIQKEPYYRGSVQDLWQVDFHGKPCLISRTSSSGSVFDVGTIFSVPRSDVLRTAIRHRIYADLMAPETWRQLSEPDFRACYQDDRMVNFLMGHPWLEDIRQRGVDTHHLGMVDGDSGEVYPATFPEKLSNLVLIEQFPIFKPIKFSFLDKHAWDYAAYFPQKRKMLALEHVFRLGNPGGSSVQMRYENLFTSGGQRLAEDFLSVLGVEGPLRPWMRFKNMVYDCTTKYEPQDRHLDWQETVHLSGIPGTLFAKVVLTLNYCTVAVNRFFGSLGFDLWDIKWEAAVDGERVVVVDTIDPDSIRITFRVEYQNRIYLVHFNKQSIRDYYRFIHPEWYSALNQAKSLAKADPRGRSFLEIYEEGVATGKYPDIPVVDEEFAELQRKKYELIADPIIRAEKKTSIEALREVSLAELNYYVKAGKLDFLTEKNAIAV